jgi:pimeloyl-ACP methyl ester carboxylesterase
LLRLILLLALTLAPGWAWATDLPDASPFQASPTFHPVGPQLAHGALVWLHGTYDPAAGGPPDEPDIVARLAAGGLDVWRFNRARGQDALDTSGAGLARGLEALRHAGYQNVVVAGHSRGAWIALEALAHAGLADAVVSISPAAFGTRPERQAEAMATWAAMWRAAARAHTRVVLVQLQDDPYDPFPVQRREIAVAESKRAGLQLLSVFLPPEPRGHIGVYEPDFDVLFGAQMAGFVSGH